MHDEVVTALQRLIDGGLDAVILESRAYYVQFAEDGSGALLVEAVDDANLDERLTPNQLRRLHDFGFRPPARGEPGNHAMTIASDAGAAARFGLAVLEGVYAASAEEVAVREV